MKRRDALVGLPAVMYAAACHAEQDKPTPPPGTGYGKPSPKNGPKGVIRTTETVLLAFRNGRLEVRPPIAVLLLSDPPPRLKWNVEIPANYTLEINFVVDYEGEVHATLGKEALPMRGPFARAQNEVRGRYLARGPVSLDSGPLDVKEESYWKYEVTVTGPDGRPFVVDPGVIVKEGEG